MKEGIFIPYQGVSCLSEHETHILKRAMLLKFHSDQKVFSGIELQLVLKIILELDAIHLDGF